MFKIVFYKKPNILATGTVNPNFSAQITNTSPYVEKKSRIYKNSS